MMTTSAALDARTSLNFKNAMTYGTSMTTFRLSGSFSNANAAPSICVAIKHPPNTCWNTLLPVESGTSL